MIICALLHWYDTNKDYKTNEEQHVGTQVQTGTPEVLATAVVAAALTDLGCLRRSISFSACPQLQHDKNTSHSSYKYTIL